MAQGAGRAGLARGGAAGFRRLGSGHHHCRAADRQLVGAHGPDAGSQRRPPDSLFLQSIHAEDCDNVGAALSQAIQSGRTYRKRYRVIDEAGRTRWVITSAKSAFNDEGKVAWLLGVVIDVTDQMETASALAESQFQFQTLTEALPQIVWSSDAGGVYDYFSARWSEFTGIDPQDITEDTWKILVHPDDQAMVAAVWAQVLRTGEAYDIDYVAPSRDDVGQRRLARPAGADDRDQSRIKGDHRRRGPRSRKSPPQR